MDFCYGENEADFCRISGQFLQDFRLVLQDHRLVSVGSQLNICMISVYPIRLVSAGYQVFLGSQVSLCRITGQFLQDHRLFSVRSLFISIGSQASFCRITDQSLQDHRLVSVGSQFSICRISVYPIRLVSVGSHISFCRITDQFLQDLVGSQISFCKISGLFLQNLRLVSVGSQISLLVCLGSQVSFCPQDSQDQEPKEKVPQDQEPSEQISEDQEFPSRFLRSGALRVGSYRAETSRAVSSNRREFSIAGSRKAGAKYANCYLVLEILVLFPLQKEPLTHSTVQKGNLGISNPTTGRIKLFP